MPFFCSLNLAFHDILVSHDFPALVVRGVDNAIYRINYYSADKCQQNKLRYTLDSDLSGGLRYPPFEQPGLSYTVYRSIVYSVFLCLHMENPLRAESPSILQEKSGRGNRPYMENFDHFKLRCDDSLGLGKN